ncbi:unnamed protein product [Ectocarpus sp. CCAP 1310/34]|nr:unnamed protein product [Ectocarpus sp. CCAP 1310/34]
MLRCSCEKQLNKLVLTSYTPFSSLAGCLIHRPRQVALSDKEREAVATSGRQEFLREQAAMLEGVRGEWAALRSALRRRVGAARTLLLTDATCRMHAVPEDRLEQPRRMDEAWRALLFLQKVYPNETVLKRSVDPAWVEMVTPETMLMLAHSRTYVDQLRTRVDEAGSSVECLTAVDGSEDDLGGLGGGDRGGPQERAMAVYGRDTVGNKRSWEAAMTAAGAVLEAVDRVLHGEAHNAFCAVRPPGHHAGVELHCMGAVSNGFCILNNVALAALYAHHYGNVARVAVVDFDVHHGNGTQDVLCRTEHPGFLYASIHAFNRGEGENTSQAKIFPGTGAEGEAHGNVLNIPLGDQVHPAGFHSATARVVAALDKFKPNLILVSAGFDAHQADPSHLGTLCARDFEVFTRRMVTAAERLCAGRMVSVLEGGYALDCQATVRPKGHLRPPSPIGGVVGRVGRKARGAAAETLADCVQAHCKGLVDGLIGAIDDD